MGFSALIKSVHRPFLFLKTCSLPFREMHHIILKPIYQSQQWASEMDLLFCIFYIFNTFILSRGHFWIEKKEISKWNETFLPSPILHKGKTFICSTSIYLKFPFLFTPTRPKINSTLIKVDSMGSVQVKPLYNLTKFVLCQEMIAFPVQPKNAALPYVCWQQLLCLWVG